MPAAIPGCRRVRPRLHRHELHVVVRPLSNGRGALPAVRLMLNKADATCGPAGPRQKEVAFLEGGDSIKESAYMTVLLGVLVFVSALAIVALIILVGIAALLEVLPPLFARRTEEGGGDERPASLPVVSRHVQLAGRSAARLNR